MLQKPRNIKELLPDPRKRYRQGFFDKFMPKRYFGKYPIIYRSSWELKFMQWCELSPIVCQWTSEPDLGISYLDMHNNYHKYFPDFLVKLTTGESWLIEVKPSKDIPRTQSDLHLHPVRSKNACKWKAAMEFCKKNPGMTFKLVTEEFFKNQKLV